MMEVGGDAPCRASQRAERVVFPDRRFRSAIALTGRRAPKPMTGHFRDASKHRSRGAALSTAAHSAVSRESFKAKVHARRPRSLIRRLRPQTRSDLLLMQTVEGAEHEGTRCDPARPLRGASPRRGAGGRPVVVLCCAIRSRAAIPSISTTCASALKSSFRLGLACPSVCAHDQVRDDDDSRRSHDRSRHS